MHGIIGFSLFAIIQMAAIWSAMELSRPENQKFIADTPLVRTVVRFDSRKSVMHRTAAALLIYLVVLGAVYGFVVLFGGIAWVIAEIGILMRYIVQWFVEAALWPFTLVF